MKTTTKKVLLLAILAAFSVGTVAQAQDASPSPEDIRPKIRAAIEKRLEPNREVRNNLLEQRKEIRTEMRADIKEMRASTTNMFRKDVRKDMREEIKKRMKMNEFQTRKDALVKELTNALSNLENISDRIDSRIEKAESAGRDMTEPKALLVTAKEKLSIARTEVSDFQNLNIGTNASTTADVELEKPRTVGDTAIKSVKAARDAFQKVVVSIAHNMGNN